MRRKTFAEVPCPVARTMDVMGDWWIPMILRETLYDVTRFSDFQRMLGISRNILTERLKAMVAHGLLERVPIGDGKRCEYIRTERGTAAISVLAAMMGWADTWVFDGRPPIQLVDRHTGQPVRPVVIDAESGQVFDAARVRVVPGPSFPSHPGALAARFPDHPTENP